MEDLTTQLSLLSIDYDTINHDPCSTLLEWTALLTALHPNIGCLKSVLLKPKGGDDKLVLLISLNSTAIQVNTLAKTLGYKEARAATDELVLKTLGIEKINVTPFCLQNVDRSGLRIIIDQGVLATETLVMRLFSNEISIKCSSISFKSYLEKNDIEYESIDPSTLAVPSKENVSTPKKKENEAVERIKDDEKEVKIGIEAKKEEDFPNWYTQVLIRTEMMDYYDISGCYIIRPWAFKIWKEIQSFFGGEIEELGVEDCYFPMFVSQRALNKEKDHIEGFAPEVAWVTKAGNSELSEPIAVRPTSETVMYPAYACWVKSHRDLPLRLNQWCNVVRWEFKHPQPFLRTREFLWQEGHTAFLTKQEADIEVMQILDLYRRVYEELLAVPVVPGKKSQKERFAGGLYTTTVEGFIPTTGRAIQGATSHCLGTNFSEMFNIMVENENKERVHVWQNSWGITTRTIGVMVMVHGDNQGLVLPPRVASIQVIVIPVGITSKTSQEDADRIYSKTAEIVLMLKQSKIRVKSDVRDNYTSGWKFNHWEMKGVPLRLEIGPRDLLKNETRVVRRDNCVSSQLSLHGLEVCIKQLLDTIQIDMFHRAKKIRDERTIRLDSWDGFVSALDAKCMILSPWCEAVACEEDVKKRSAKCEDENIEIDEKAPSMGAKTLCIPFNQPEGLVAGVTKCFACSDNALSYTLWGRSY